MGMKRIGELLSELVPLTRHDVEEILNEQAATRRAFGDIAISMGLCEARHIWQAWFGQLGDSPRRIDLKSFGVDSQAIAMLPSSLATRCNAVPVRMLGEVLIVAVSVEHAKQAVEILRTELNLNVRFVLAASDDIRLAIQTYYPQHEMV